MTSSRLLIHYIRWYCVRLCIRQVCLYIKDNSSCILLLRVLQANDRHLIFQTPCIFTLAKFMCRAAWANECFQSECKLICDDLIRLGYSNIVMDPSVRVTYDVSDARRCYDPEAVSYFCKISHCHS